MIINILIILFVYLLIGGAFHDYFSLHIYRMCDKGYITFDKAEKAVSQERLINILLWPIVMPLLFIFKNQKL